MRKSLLLAGAVAGILFVPIYKALAVQPPAQAEQWRAVATEQDRQRLRGWRQAWVEGLRAARVSNGAEVRREGVLLEPDAAQLDPEPAAGDYRCRTLKLGNAGGNGLNWVAYPEFRCRISRHLAGLRFDKIGGSQRPGGYLHPAGPRRMIFLGSMQLGDERHVLPYGNDPRRDMAGILERVAERRWRLVFPRPAYESVIDVIELIPAD
jgi:hypothetical protein